MLCFRHNEVTLVKFCWTLEEQLVSKCLVEMYMCICFN